MKYCEECGTKLRNDAEFCYQCGAPCSDISDQALYLVRAEAYRREQKQRGKGEGGSGTGRTVWTVLALIILAAVMFYIWFSPGRRSFQYAVNGQTQSAKELYGRSVRDNVAEAFILRMLTPRGARSIVDAYRSGEIAYTDAAERLRTLSEMEAPLNNAARASETMEALYKSDEAYRLGEKSEAEGDFRSAMLAYRMVAPKDSRYEAAAKKAVDMENRYKSEVLKMIGVPETEEEYASYVKTLEASLAVLPDDGALTDAMAALKQNFAVRIKAQTVPVMTDYIAKGYYAEAIELGKRALIYNPEDADLKSLVAGATTNYEEFIRSQVNIYLANGDKEGAKAFLDRVGQDLPGDPVVAQMYEKL